MNSRDGYKLVSVIGALLIQFIHATVCKNTEQRCPTNLLHLDELVNENGWSIHELDYKVRILPHYSQNNVTKSELGYVKSFSLESNCDISMHLQKDHKSINCKITIDSYQVNYPEDPFGIKNSTEMSSGTLHFEDMSSQPGTQYFQLVGLFPVNNAISAIRGKYTVIVGQPQSSNYTVLSNMPPSKSQKQNTQMNGWIIWKHFQPTIPLYPEQVGVAIIGGQLKKLEHKDDKLNYKITLYFHSDSEQHKRNHTIMQCTNCTLKRATDYLKYYESKFGVKYPLEKLDIILTSSTRGDFSSVGIAVQPGRGYQTTCPDPNWVWQHQVSAFVRQWTSFIKISTTKYSNDLYSGLLNYISSWGDKDSMTSQEFRRVQHAYLVVLENVFTKPILQTAIGNLLNEIIKENKNLQVDDIFEVVEETLKVCNQTNLLPNKYGGSLKNVLGNWIAAQEGGYFSKIDVTLNNLGQVKISQKIITNKNQKDSTIHNEQGMWLPVEIVREIGSEKKVIWLSSSTNSTLVTLENPLNTQDYILLNQNVLVFFPIIYDANLAKRIARQLARNHTAIPLRARARFIVDNFQFPLTYEMNLKVGLDTAFELTRYLEKQHDPYIVEILMGSVRELFLYDFDLDSLGKIENYFGNIVDTAFKQVGFELSKNAADCEHKDLPRTLISAGVKMKAPAVTAFAKKLMSEWKQNPNHNPFEQNSIIKIYSRDLKCLALLGSGPDDKSGLYNFYLEMLLAERNRNLTDDESCKILLRVDDAVFCTENPDIVIPHLKLLAGDAQSGNRDCDAASNRESRIIDEHPGVIKFLFQLLKEKYLNENGNLSLFGSFVDPDIKGGRSFGQVLALLDDLEQLVKDSKMEDSSVKLIQDGVNHFKNRWEKSKTGYIMSGLQWLTEHGYGG